MSSRLVHVTVVPAGTVSVPGPKLKLSIFTSVVSAFCCALARTLTWRMSIVPSPITSATVRTAIDTLLLMFFFLSFDLRSDWFLGFCSFRLCKRQIDDRQCVLPLNVIHIRDSQNALELLARHLNGTWRFRLARLLLLKLRPHPC